MTIQANKLPQATYGKPATMVAVAKHAGVSRAAVYAVLKNDNRTGNIGVGAETRNRILDAADELGYVRNQTARALASGKTHNIGVVVHTLKTGFFTDFLTQFDDTCYHDGYTVSISSSEYDRAREARHLEMLLSHRVDGLLLALAWTDAPRNRELLEQFRSHGIPVVLLGHESRDHVFPRISFQSKLISQLMSRHLSDLGHRRVAFLGACDAIDASQVLHRERMETFVKAWDEIGRAGSVAPQCLNVQDTDYGGIAMADVIASMPKAERPTAVACSTDVLAMGLIHGLRNKGLDVPRDISVIGCDDIPDACRQAVPLSTIRLPVDKLACEAWRMLSGALQNPHALDHNPCVLIDPELISRASTRCVL